MAMNEHLKALIEKRNSIAGVINTEGVAILEKKAAIDKDYSKDSDDWKSKMAELETEITAQKERRAEVMELDGLIEVASEVNEMEIVEKMIGKDSGQPLTDSAMAAASTAALYPEKKQRFFDRFTYDFHQFLQKNNLTSREAVQGRTPRESVVLPSGEKFHAAASFYGTFDTSRPELYAASKSIGLDHGISDQLEVALKAKRDAFAKSMFTQHPLAGGDGSLYDPTAVFPGNTGGLCEYLIDNTIDVFPYPKASFLDCIPVRRISKSYMLYVRQTLRVNNASAVGESVQLAGTNNPTGAPVDFLVEKPESEFGFSQAKAYTITFADTLPVSEEFLEDCPQIADIVENQLMENVRQVFYDQLLNGDGSDGENPEILGLLAQVGVSTRIHKGAASFWGNVMGAGNADNTIRETLELAVFDAEAYGYTVDCIIMSHADYVKMVMLRDEDGHKLYTDAEADTVRGAKIRADIRMPVGTAIAGAFRQVVQILIRRALRLDIGWVDNQFKVDMLTLRATMRGGLLVRVPHALIRITALNT